MPFLRFPMRLLDMPIQHKMYNRLLPELLELDFATRNYNLIRFWEQKYLPCINASTIFDNELFLSHNNVKVDNTSRKICCYNFNSLISKSEMPAYSLLTQVEWCLNKVRIPKAGRQRQALRTQHINIV